MPHALIEQDIGNLVSAALADSPDRFITIKCVAKKIGAKAGKAVELCNRDVEADRLEILRTDHDAHVVVWASPPLARAVEMPASVHAQMRSKKEIARKIDDQVFAGRANALNRSSANRLARELRQRGLESRDDLSGQCLIQIARDAKDGVAFRHDASDIPSMSA